MGKVIKGIISIFMIIISLIGGLYLYNLGILPNSYIVGVFVTLIIVNSICCILLFKKGIISTIISIIIYFIIGIVSIAIIYYAGNTSEYLDTGFSNNVEYTTYSVIVLGTSNYNNISELENTNMGYLYLDEDNSYLDEVKNNINVNLNEYDLFSLYNKLSNNEITSIVINNGYIDLLEENFDDYSSNTKVIYSYKIETEETEVVDKEIKLKPFNIYLAGTDSRDSNLESNTKSDVNMVITVNPITKKVLITSIPRDYYVQINGTTGLKDKLTHVGIYGTEKSKRTIEDLLNIDIDYTVKVGFNSVIKLVDLVGGVDIYSDTAFVSHCRDGGAKRVRVEVGMNHFNGAEALSYARERYAYSDGDVHRIKNQQQVIEAVVNKLLSDPSFLLKYDTLLESLSDLYITNVPSELVKLLIKEQINNMSTFSIEKQNLVGYDGMGQTYSIPGMNLYVMVPNQESVVAASNKILEYMNS